MTNIWFQLVDSRGQPFRGAKVDFVSIPDTEFVAKFKKVVKSENPNTLSTVDALNLIVYENQQKFNENTEFKKLSSKIQGGLDEDDPIIVVVPDQNLNEQVLSIGITNCSTYF